MADTKKPAGAEASDPQSNSTPSPVTTTATAAAELPSVPTPHPDLNPKPVPAAQSPEPLPDAPQPQHPLAKLNEELQKNNIHFGLHSLYGTLASADYKPAEPSTTSVNGTSDRKAIEVEHAYINNHIDGTVSYGFTRGARKGFNTFEGDKTNAGVVVKLGPVVETVKGEVHAGEALVQTQGAPVVDPASSQHEIFPVAARNLPDFGGSIRSTTGVPLGIPTKSLGQDDAQASIGPDRVNIRAQIKGTTLDHERDIGVYARVATVMDGAMELDVGKTLAGDAGGKTGMHSPKGFNAYVEVNDPDKVKHGLSNILHKIFHHHHSQERN